MSRRRLEVDGRLVTIAPDDTPRVTERTSALVQARPVDELSGLPPTGPVAVTSPARGAYARVGGDGMVGLVGIPRLLFPRQDLTDYSLDLAVTAPGYLPYLARAAVANPRRSIAAPAPAAGADIVTLDSTAGLQAGQRLSIGSLDAADVREIRALGPAADQVTLDTPLANARVVGDPVLPDAFTPSDLGDLHLRHRPIVVRGRVVRIVGGNPVPAAGATVTLLDTWRRLPGATGVAPDAATLVALRPPLYADRASPSARLRRHTITSVAADTKTLLLAAPTGGRQLRLSDRVGLGPGTLLLLDPDDPDLTECLEVDTVESGAPDQAGVVTLHHALRHSHRSQARVLLATPQASGPPKVVTVDALAGDRSLFISDAVGLSSGDRVLVSSAGEPDEFHELQRHSVTSDALGYYRLPPLHRVALLELRATLTLGGGQPALTQQRVFSPDYSRENHLDFTVTPP